MIVAFSGHRPKKLAHWVPDFDRLVAPLDDRLRKLKAGSAISGMAQGIDQLAARICCVRRLPWTAAVPFKGQEYRWPPQAQKSYRLLLGLADQIVYVSPPPPPGSAHYVISGLMQLRNHWMVERSDRLIAVWDGTSGGTWNCIAYALSVGKPIDVFDPQTFKWKLNSTDIRVPNIGGSAQYRYK